MIIGITGGVGCGKSEVLRLLNANFGAYIIEADEVSRNLMQPGKRVYEQVERVFPESKNKDGIIDRQKLASIVFADDKKVKQLNDIIHPLVREEICDKITQIQNNDKDAFIVIEAALLIEAGYSEICDEMWYIYCKKEVREKRLIAGRGYTIEKIHDIMSNQLSEENFKKYTDRTIDNSGTIEDTLLQIKKIGYIRKRGNYMLTKVNTDKAPAAIGPYSQAIKVNGMVFTSGQIPINPETGEIVGNDIASQAEQVMKNLGAVLEEAGSSYENAVKTVCFLSNMSDFAEFNAVYEKYFTGKPARSCVGVKELPKAVLCEVEVIAVIG